MKTRVRFGIRVRLPFGLFPNCAVFVLNLSASNLELLRGQVTGIQEVLTLAGYPTLAERLFVETA
jgi:hypothetical protein